MNKDVLIVVDMQYDFTKGTLGNEAALKIVPAIVERINEFKGSVIVATRDTHTEDYLNTQEGKYLPVEHCIEGTLGHDILSDIEVALAKAKNRGVTVIYVDKSSFGYIGWRDVFRTTPDKITLVGTCTGICVLSNAVILKAIYPEVPIEVVGNECACISEDTHVTALKALKLVQVDII